MRILVLTLLTVTSFLFLLFSSCNSENDHKELPNIVLIMADDMGYECLGANGSLSYRTPNLDKLAESGTRFTHCISQPLCTPSRVKIMTGMYNYRNYEYFGYLNTNQRTFGHVLKEAGYKTCIAGKWQLNGLAYGLEGFQDDTRPHQLGFDEYCLWQLTHPRKEGERFADPLIEQNGQVLDLDIDDYGPDIFKNFVLNFIERNHENRFFVYYPMVLVHDPFVPTPDSEEWQNPELRYKDDTTYFKDMMSYTDKIVGQIQQKLNELGIRENTLLIFTADNGTHPRITTQTISGPVRGGKGNTIDAGTRVPLIISWPKMGQQNRLFEGLIEFSDFFATFADLVDKESESDGVSFLPLFKGDDYKGRETAYVYYDPQWGKNVNRYRGQFVRTIQYKLYETGKFYNLDNDQLERNPLDIGDLSGSASSAYHDLMKVLDDKPSLPEELAE